MLKKLFKDGYLNIDKLLVDNFSKLKLTERELIVLIQMFNLAQIKKNINVKTIKARVGFSSAEICEIFDSLVAKGFVTVDMIVKNDKQESVIDVFACLDKLYDFLQTEKRLSELDENENQMKKIVKLCEEELEKTLSSNDLLIVSHWVEDNVSYDTIKWALFDSLRTGHSSLNYVDKVIANGKN